MLPNVLHILCTSGGLSSGCTSSMHLHWMCVSPTPLGSENHPVRVEADLDLLASLFRGPVITFVFAGALWLRCVLSLDLVPFANPAIYTDVGFRDNFWVLMPHDFDDFLNHSLSFSLTRSLTFCLCP